MEKKDQEKKIDLMEALEWQSVEGFIQLHHDHMATGLHNTYKSAYEAAEKDYQSVFMRRRYADFMNFTTSKWRYLRRQQKHKNNKSNESKNPGPTGE